MPRSHGHYLHIPDPDICTLCYSRGEPCYDSEFSIVAEPDENGHTEYVAYSQPNELHRWPVGVRTPKPESTHAEVVARMMVWEDEPDLCLPDWHWDMALGQNPFLSARDAFEITQTLEVLTHQLDDVFPA